MKWHRLTTDGRFKRDLAWSPQGDLLYFGLQQTPELLAIHQFDLATGQISRLRRRPCEGCHCGQVVHNGQHGVTVGQHGRRTPAV